MFTYFQCYMPETWQAQIDRGLIDENSGIRFVQTITLNEDKKFNKLAAKDGDLWNILQSTKMPFYIDRLQGGSYIDTYPYNQSLINSYKELLGERFFGFQFHEWMNNFRSDIRKLDRGNCTNWTKENIEATIRKMFPGKYLFLEAMTLEELANNGRPMTIEAFLHDSSSLLKKRMESFDNALIPCDSSSLSYPMEVALGVKRIMAEIGAQTPDTRVQIAFARGIAKTHNIPFGTYIEPWAGHPANAFCYHRDGLNEWGLYGKDFPYQASGELGGSSRSLQKRMQIYSYFSGATFMSEEWGMCNTFYDWHDFELSPYGIVKYDFLQLVKKYPNIGTPYTPIGIVISKDLPVLPELEAENTLYQYPVYGSFAEKLQIARKGIKDLLATSLPMVGNEEKFLKNTSLPDVFDIIQDDSPSSLSKYDYLVNLTGDDSLQNKYPCISVDEVPMILEKTLPCFVKGNAHWMLNKTNNGWFLIVFNHDGIERNKDTGEKHLQEGNHTVSVKVSCNKELIKLEGEGVLSKENDVWYISLPVGGWFLGKL